MGPVGGRRGGSSRNQTSVAPNPVASLGRAHSTLTLTAAHELHKAPRTSVTWEASPQARGAALKAVRGRVRPAGHGLGAAVSVLGGPQRS